MPARTERNSEKPPSNGVILLIRDGWGYRKETNDNAIVQASTPVADELDANYPRCLLDASGRAVGLPEGYQGNSEVGHAAIGAGRIIQQSLVRVDDAIADGSFFENKAFKEAIRHCKENSTLHLMGLLQVEGVHSHSRHLNALLDLCAREGFERVLVHVFTDGRDAPVNDSLKHVAALEGKFASIGFGKIASLCGRYYAMDRNGQWGRTKTTFDCVAKGEAEEFDSALDCLRAKHAGGETDEFVKPAKARGYVGFSKGDAAIFFNYRTDRPQQLTRAFTDASFEHFERNAFHHPFFVTMTSYYDDAKALVAFPNEPPLNTLGETVSKAGLKQLRIAETEKYAHVTFFFNGQRREPFPREARVLVPSPKVATYDLKPEMSAFEITEKLIGAIASKEYALIVVNLANCDMVGHTGAAEAIQKAVEAVDECTDRIMSACSESGYDLLVFADHGNAEDQTAEWRTSHTTNPVPFYLVSGRLELKGARLRGGGLKDVAPTALRLLGLPTPVEMTGSSLF